MLDMKTTLFGLSLFATFCVWRVDSLAFNFGACPAIRGMPNFEPAKYLGPWYEYANTFEIYQIGQSCVRATYTDEGPTQVGVFNEGINTITGNYANIKGNARITNPSDTRAELKVAFDIVPFGQGGNEPNYFVVETDYTSYSLVYNCSPKLFLKKESLWLLTRQQTPSAAFVKWAYRYTIFPNISYRFAIEDVTTTQHSSSWWGYPCFYVSRLCSIPQTILKLRQIAPNHTTELLSSSVGLLVLENRRRQCIELLGFFLGNEIFLLLLEIILEYWAS